ncbi:NYN domain-containing protein [Caenibius sp. WL]|uniref:NYN domain-containing protein n=1 Tax=Caenibius sp. WL TaxID=2872646 RepID=UPI001C99730A|nr:NYN domain-containing protein [Caenibius sp. WL]QZP07060.1 NYN domain-containing protein [Caenibius sp. WL]
MAAESLHNIALLIDADNASPAGIDSVLTVLAELGQVNIRRAYGNWRKTTLKGWADIVHRYGIEPQQQFDLTKGKNATDMKMTIDAMDMLYRGRVHGFGIMSSDSDFTPLAMRIRQDGYPVYGFGSGQTPEAFRQACTRFIDVDALTKAERAAKGQEQPQEKPRMDETLLNLLINAYNASKRDERGFAKLAEVGQRAGNRSSFDTRSYGYPRLIDLIEATPSFITERREGGQVWIKRLR